MKDGIKRRKVNDRLTANDGICAFEGCNEQRYTSLHSYCIEHRRLVARIAQRKYEAKKRAAQLAPDGRRARL